MKIKTLIITLLWVLPSSFLIAQGVINGDFEAWSNKVLLYRPADINTGNLEQFISGGNQLTLRTDLAAHGNAAIMLKSQRVGQDTLFGYFLYGQPGSNGNISGGTPFTEIPTSVTLSLKYHTYTTAEAIILIIFKKNGIFLTNQIISVAGDQPVWKDTTISITTFTDTPDSVIFGVAAANPFLNRYHPDNWIAVDYVRFNGVTGQLPNHDFEVWNDYEAEEPEGWNTFNLFYLMEGKPVNVTKSTDAHSGNYSISVKTSVLNIFGSNFDTLGIATTGKISEKGYSGGFPMRAKPDSLTFYYKYNNSNQIKDLAVVYAQFSRFDSLNGRSVVIDSGLALLPASFQWKRIKITFNPASPIPDTANLLIASSAMLFGPAGVGNQVLVDDMMFYFNGTGIPVKNLIQNKFRVYPNPAQDKLFIEVSTSEMKKTEKWDIMTTEGKLLKKVELVPLGNNIYELNINDIPSGSYFLYEPLNQCIIKFLKP